MKLRPTEQEWRLILEDLSFWVNALQGKALCAERVKALHVAGTKEKGVRK